MRLSQIGPLANREDDSFLSSLLSSKTKGKKPEAALQLQSLGLFSCFLDNVLIACLASGSAGLLAAGDCWGFFVLVPLRKEK